MELLYQHLCRGLPEVISSYLYPDFLFNERNELTLKEQKQIETLIIGVAEQKLRDIFKESYDAFVQAMQASDACIAGGFVLACIYSDVKVKDVDIFHCANHLRCQRFEPSILRFFHDSCTIGQDYKDNPNQINLKYSTRLNYSPETQWVADYNWYGNEIQVISYCSRLESSRECVQKYFDFDVCKITLWFDRNKLKVFVPDWNCLVTRTCPFKYMDNKIDKAIARYYKYVEKGFKFTFDPNLVETILNTFNLESGYERKYTRDVVLILSLIKQYGAREISDREYMQCNKCCGWHKSQEGCVKYPDCILNILKVPHQHLWLKAYHGHVIYLGPKENCSFPVFADVPKGTK